MIKAESKISNAFRHDTALANSFHTEFATKIRPYFTSEKCTNIRQFNIAYNAQILSMQPELCQYYQNYFFNVSHKHSRHTDDNTGHFQVCENSYPPRIDFSHCWRQNRRIS